MALRSDDYFIMILFLLVKKKYVEIVPTEVLNSLASRWLIYLA